VYFTLFIKWKTGNQLKTYLVQLLADKNEYIDDSFVVVLSQERFKKIILKVFFRDNVLAHLSQAARLHSTYVISYLLKMQNMIVKEPCNVLLLNYMSAKICFKGD